MGDVEPISVDALVLRARFPELTLRPGSNLVARVAARAEGHGVIVLAGLPLTAKLPDDVTAGETLKLTVAEVSSERIVLRMEQPAAPVAVPPPPPPPPSRAGIGIEEPPRRHGSPADGESWVALSFRSEALGRLDLRIRLGPGDVQVTVDAPRGAALTLAGRHADELRQTLEKHLGGRATVRVQPRREPLDLYA
ncbi:MAG: hypothetical protein AVDCRST_MAG69-2930 [uncultured Solirubrobacteraceae bacterium]|uniref:Uncharacterized protein n=1 Tax=uncultured Solirubrobacteraceae bacterium TaxID=1162706 RepID=A0A6J4TBM7_9ACTN|nr:MAG: hypothetical protein AVDCRST_MAG69-2930 [uncultured Solirubrobacteraceae bacterium]